MCLLNRQNLIKFIIIFSIILFSSCASVDQHVTLAPIYNSFPVSASSSVYINGLILSKAEYHILKEFKFEKVFSIKLKNRDVKIDLQSDLKKIIEQANAKGIVELKIDIKDIDTSAVSWITLERYGGFIGVGGGFGWYVIQNYMQTDETNNNTDTLITSAAMVGSGALLFGGSILHESLGTIKYTLEISGKAITY